MFASNSLPVTTALFLFTTALTDGAGVVAAFVASLSATKLEPAEECLLIDELSRRTGIGKNPIKAQLKDARTAAGQKRQDLEREHWPATRTDPRPRLPRAFAH
jgi:hypothetical protein